MAHETVFLRTTAPEEPDTVLSTQEAAEVLNVSPPYFIQLLEHGEIPYRTLDIGPGVRLGDVLAYKARIDTERRKVLDELSAQAQELGMGYQ